jgi:tetraacyldisaccharide 4'-kinase
VILIKFIELGQEMMKLFKLLLYPFAGLYNLGTRFRNHLFDIGQKPSFEFDTTVIVVGNLNVGGSGKTPMIEYLIRLLGERFKVATLSRGYKRETSGYRLARDTDDAHSIGDEPLQLYRKFGKEIKVVVGEDRAAAIPHILHDFPETDVILLDDALQHRSVRPQLSVLLTDFSNPFFADFILPYGGLREARTGSSRADVIVVTKCPGGLSADEQDRTRQSIQRYAGIKPVFFSTIKYEEPLSFGKPGHLSTNIVLVSGIAMTQHLMNFSTKGHKIVKHFDFPDHHRYSNNDLINIEHFCNGQSEPFVILTTEKDMVKLIEPAFRPLIERWPWFYVPIRQEFLQDGLKFDELILGSCRKRPVTG